MTQNLSTALALAEAGVHVFPAIVVWNDATQKLDKRPAISGWREAASTDPQQIARWWATFPAAVPGIELGRSGLFVVDLDRHAGGADGVAAFKSFRGDNPAPRCLSQNCERWLSLVFPSAGRRSSRQSNRHPPAGHRHPRRWWLDGRAGCSF